MNKIARTAAALSAAAFTVGLAGPANAELFGIDDPNDSPHGSDLFAASVDHRAHKLVIETTHDNLRRAPSSGSGGVVFIDTDSEDPGPEYAFVAGFTEGTDYQLIEVEAFRPETWGEPVEGSYSLDVDYAADTATFVISRGAIGNPDEVRVAIRVSGPAFASRDWLGQAHSFTPWLARG
ncbi:hypothetical protein F0U44_01990 [Nocardioides humilatus]|uniref:Uncharacterized protein n=1 Tax=Nocardioides humilatus TaxID=2607660 RepID=A0A5B1LND1_9ACTN|nr:hypothetical protein [Nocardioides humilatus]KAA1421117.1 hypothetical protein F0U44_01990 [Nocardioides humilatus]